MGPLKPIHKLHSLMLISSYFQAYANKRFLAKAESRYC
jgi:hypothetical protein